MLRPLHVILWFLVHRPDQILFMDFYLIISTTHAQNGPCGTKWCDNNIHLQNNEIHKVKLIII